MGKGLNRVIVKGEVQEKKYQDSPIRHTDNVDILQGWSFPVGWIERKPNRVNSVDEATKLFKKRGWIQIFSGHLNQSVYLVKYERTQVPDSSIPRYTEAEIDALKGLNLDELKTLHEAKALFGGTIHEKEVNR